MQHWHTNICLTAELQVQVHHYWETDNYHWRYWKLYAKEPIVFTTIETVETENMADTLTNREINNFLPSTFLKYYENKWALYNYFFC